MIKSRKTAKAPLLAHLQQPSSTIKTLKGQQWQLRATARGS